jgi:methionyl aminopeptidase
MNSLTIQDEYFKAGKIAAEVRSTIESKDLVGMYYEALCNYVEKEIIRKGGKPAFPCNVCVNATAAHYTAEPGDKNQVKEGDVVKVDIGVHVNGYIADTAITLCYNADYLGLVQATKAALAEGLKLVREGVRTSEIGKAISSTAERNGFKPISNLSGHSLEPYTIHAGVSIPNIWVPKSNELKAGQVYAIEPFLTSADGAGVVVDAPANSIFRLVSRKKVNSKDLNEFAESVWGEFKTLPFAKRWLAEMYSRAKIDSYTAQLEKMRILHAYPVLVEARNSVVAQAEHTVTPQPNSFIILTQ